MTNPKFSVVIPAYNEEKYLPRCFSSLEKQTLPKEDFEIVVVDNGSTDKTAKVAKDLGAKVILEPRKGVVFARQRGAEEARGKIIAFTDADTRVPPDWLETIGKAFEKDDSLVCVVGPVSYPTRDIFVKSYALVLQFLVKSLQAPGLCFNGQNFAVRKEIFDKAAGFDLRFGPIGAEHHLLKRLEPYGKIKVLPGLSVFSSPRRFQRAGYLKTLSTYFLLEASVFLDFPLLSSFKCATELKKKRN